MKRIFSIYILGFVLVTSLFSSNLISAETETIPNWIKKIAKFWSEGITNDTEFVNALQYLIDKKIISIQDNIHAPHIVILTDKQQYKVGEPINITVTNTGNALAQFGGRPLIGIVSNIDGKSVCCFGTEAITYLHPNKSSRSTWNQISLETSSQVKPGWYTIHAIYSVPDENYQNSYETRKAIEIIN